MEIEAGEENEKAKNEGLRVTFGLKRIDEWPVSQTQWFTSLDISTIVTVKRASCMDHLGRNSRKAFQK